MHYQLVKELIKRDKSQKNMIEGTTKREPKKDVCHFAIILEVMFQNWFPLQGVESREKTKVA
jgi:hypothetical protein